MPVVLFSPPASLQPGWVLGQSSVQTFLPAQAGNAPAPTPTNPGTVRRLYQPRSFKSETAKVAVRNPNSWQTRSPLGGHTAGSRAGLRRASPPHQRGAEVGPGEGRTGRTGPCRRGEALTAPRRVSLRVPNRLGSLRVAATDTATPSPSRGAARPRPVGGGRGGSPRAARARHPGPGCSAERAPRSHSAEGRGAFGRGQPGQLWPKQR